MFLAGLFALGASPKSVEAAVRTLPGLERFRIVFARVKRGGISAHRARVECAAKATARDLGAILGMIERSKLDKRVKDTAAAVFRELGTVEGRIHGVPAARVHFHEVGAVDSIVDIVGAAVALGQLGFPAVFHRPFTLGSGTVMTAHGPLPVPAPATLALLAGRTVRMGREQGEIVTPTGAALMRALAEELPPTKLITPERIVYTVGTRTDDDNPGMLRLVTFRDRPMEREVVVVRTTIDDMVPETYGYVQERLFEAGALDVYLTQLIMKKGRPGILLTALCESSNADRIVDLLFRETTTLGVRIAVEGRVELERWTDLVDTAAGEIEVKRSRLPDGSIKSAPEYESCRARARETGIPIKDIYDRTLREPLHNEDE
jgi:uncharacterized protein (TIGR00299 family) protein